MSYQKKTTNKNYSKRYSAQFRADAVEAYRNLRAEDVVNAEGRVAEEFGCSRASVTAWFRADREARRLGLRPPVASRTEESSWARSFVHPHVAPDVAARNEAVQLADVMATEAVSDHSTGGIHPTLTAYENAAEQYDHQRGIVDTLHAELSVHSERLAGLETTRDEAKKALQEIVNGL